MVSPTSGAIDGFRMGSLSNVRIVLVEPREAGNVGAAARAMKNFGLSDLTIVGAPGPLDAASEWWASGAQDIVDSSRRVRTLVEALEGVHLAVATSSGRGRIDKPDRSPRDIASLHAELDERLRMAIVFGRERSGLTNDELDLCAEHASAPTSPLFPVMNLAQAVSLFCYELARSSSAAERTAETDVADADGLAPYEQIERVHSKARDLLLRIGFLNPENPDAVYGELRRFIGRSRPTSRERPCRSVTC